MRIKLGARAETGIALLVIDPSSPASVATAITNDSNNENATPFARASFKNASQRKAMEAAPRQQTLK